MILFPNIKINLGLRVGATRPDGYHDIVTVMVPVGWCDILEITPARGLATTLTVTGLAPTCPPEKNLVAKALRAVEARCGSLPPVDIRLHKIIPDGAGLWRRLFRRRFHRPRATTVFFSSVFPMPTWPIYPLR